MGEAGGKGGKGGGERKDGMGERAGGVGGDGVGGAEWDVVCMRGEEGEREKRVYV
jgi:hypothetical protein